MFTGSNGDRPSVPNYLILLTFGLFGNSTSNWLEAVAARANQINIIAVSSGVSASFLYPEKKSKFYLVNKLCQEVDKNRRVFIRL